MTNKFEKCLLIFILSLLKLQNSALGQTLDHTKWRSEAGALKLEQHIDLNFPFKLKYSSRSLFVGLWGLGWCTPLDWTLIKSLNHYWIKQCDEPLILKSRQVVNTAGYIEVRLLSDTLKFSTTGELRLVNGFKIQRDFLDRPIALISNSVQWRWALSDRGLITRFDSPFRSFAVEHSGPDLIRFDQTFFSYSETSNLIEIRNGKNKQTFNYIESEDIYNPTGSWKPQPMDMRKIRIVIIDTGFTSKESELKSNIRFDLCYDFANKTIGCEDEHGHGTHVTSLLMSQIPRELWPRVEIIPLKFFSSTASPLENIQSFQKALARAVELRPDLVNISGGGAVPDPQERQWIRELGKNSALVVAAAGNEGSDLSHTPFFPASYPYPHILSVANLESPEGLHRTSNYSKDAVKIAALGTNQKGLGPLGPLALTGTSQAAARASGVAASLWLTRSEMRKPEALIQHLIETSQWIDKLQTKVRCGGQISLNRALSMRGPRSENLARPRRVSNL